MTKKKIKAVGKFISEFKAKDSLSLQHNELRLQIIKGEVYKDIDAFWLPYLEDNKII
jgi:hypothetical protein